ncbi:MAG TPA: MFS transporter [Erysipelotrichaceae bacterium]|nr:MFS transporter [Erysipelotrichaceae bacterium]
MNKKLYNKDYLLLLQGSAFSVFGDILYSIAISVWVYEKTHSTSLMGIMASISLFVTMFGSPIAGAFVDRGNRKWIIIMTDFIRAILMFGVAYLSFQENLSVFIVLFAAVVAAFCHLFFVPASMTVMVDLIPEDKIMKGQSLHQGIVSLLNFAGKALSGVLIIVFGVSWMILINAISFLLSAFSELFINVPSTIKSQDVFTFKKVFIDLKNGALETFNDKMLRKLIFLALSINLFSSGVYHLFLPFTDQKGLDIVHYGYLMSVLSLAGIVGMAITASIDFKPKQQHQIMVYGFLIGMSFEAIAYLSTGFYTLSILFFLGNVLGTIANASLNAVLILAIPKEKRALVIGFVMAGSSGGIALSSLGYGLLAEFIPLSILGASGMVIALIPMMLLGFDRRVKALFLKQEMVSNPLVEQMSQSSN